MKTLTCKTRWIGALMTSLLLVGLASGTALADDPADSDGLYPDYPSLYPADPEDPTDPDDLYADDPTLYPQDPADFIDVFVDGNLILAALPFLMSVVVH